MSNTRACPFPTCGQIFSKAFELKKHKAIHENPDSVFYCSLCEFFTLQKKNLAIHFAIHTGEKEYECPDKFTHNGREEQCDYRTNDPAALTKHRKKVHAYIPPPNRVRGSKKSAATPAAPRKPRGPRKKQEGKVTRPRRSFLRPGPASRRKLAGINDTVSSSTSTESPEASSPFLWQGGVDAYGQPTDTSFSDVSECESSTSSCAMLVTPIEEMNLDTLYDPSLHPDWMAKYEMGYEKLDATGMKHVPESLPAAGHFTLPGADMLTGRGGCLCPEWMIEAGIEGWDQSVLDMHKDFYALAD